MELEDLRDTASSRRAASRSAHVEAEVTRGVSERLEERNEEMRWRRRSAWRVWSRHNAKEAAVPLGTTAEIGPGVS